MTAQEIAEALEQIYGDMRAYLGLAETAESVEEQLQALESLRTCIRQARRLLKTQIADTIGVEKQTLPFKRP